MARIGVDYEVVKQTAIKLLTQGAAPSVQKIREVLGTGSNTTIAEHLKNWREEYANQKIHHLPASLPKELIAATEVLWQTAMEKAAHELAAIKTDLSEQQEKLRLDRVSMDQTLGELRTRLAQAQETIDEKTNQSQALQTELAVTQERFKHQIEETETIKKQYEARLNRAYDEKNSALEKMESLQSEMENLKHAFSEQLKIHRGLLTNERAMQEQSELRWVKLIDQAQTKTDEQRKQYESVINKHHKQVENTQIILSELQNKYVAQQPILDRQKSEIANLTEQLAKTQMQYNEACTTIAVLKTKIHDKPRKAKSNVSR